jgi:hypothetical protein
MYIQTKRHTNRQTKAYVHHTKTQKHIPTYIQTNRHSYRQTDRQTNKQTRENDACLFLFICLIAKYFICIVRQMRWTIISYACSLWGKHFLISQGSVRYKTLPNLTFVRNFNTAQEVLDIKPNLTFIRSYKMVSI